MYASLSLSLSLYISISLSLYLCLSLSLSIYIYICVFPRYRAEAQTPAMRDPCGRPPDAMHIRATQRDPTPSNQTMFNNVELDALNFNTC